MAPEVLAGPDTFDACSWFLLLRLQLHRQLLARPEELYTGSAGQAVAVRVRRRS